MSAEDDVDLSVDAQECSASSPLLLLRLSRFSRSSAWWGRWQGLEGSAVPHGVLEVSTVPEGVAHVLVVRAKVPEEQSDNLLPCSLPFSLRSVSMSLWKRWIAEFFG
jgi:hypothetical protein